MKILSFTLAIALAFTPAAARPQKPAIKTKQSVQILDLNSGIAATNKPLALPQSFEVSLSSKMYALKRIGLNIPESTVKSINNDLWISPSKPLGDKFGMNLIDVKSVSTITDIAEIYDTKTYAGTGIAGSAFLWYEVSKGSAALISCRVMSVDLLAVSYGDGNPQGQAGASMLVTPQNGIATFAVPTSKYSGATREYIMINFDKSISGAWQLGRCNFQFLP